MDIKEYKEKKLDKLTRDVVKMVNATPSFGYGDVIDAITKTALTNYLLTLVAAVEIRENDIEILSQSVTDELQTLTGKLIGKIKSYQRDIENAE